MDNDLVMKNVTIRIDISDAVIYIDLNDTIPFPPIVLDSIPESDFPNCPRVSLEGFERIIDMVTGAYEAKGCLYMLDNKNKVNKAIQEDNEEYAEMMNKIESDRIEAIIEGSF